MIQADEVALPKPVRRVKNLVEPRDLRYRVLRAVSDFEKREVFLRNEPEFEKAFGKKLHPCLPIFPRGRSNSTTGTMRVLPVCIRVSTSNASSIVPKPPGSSAKACASFTKLNLRVKK